MTRTVATFVSLLAGLAGCQDDVATPFPPGLEPFEDNRVPDFSFREELRTSSRDDDVISVHGRGFIFTDPTTLWGLAKDPAAMIARCRTDEQLLTSLEDPAYELIFRVHYIVYDILTVEWDDEWRYGSILGTPDALELGMIKHQKVQGSDFIDASEGTIQLIATDDPGITEVAFVEHLDAIAGGTGDVENGMHDNYNRLLALAHGEPPPACP